jgi:transcription antitermination factor NusG
MVQPTMTSVCDTAIRADAGLDRSGDVINWYAVRVRSRCEKMASIALAARGYDVCSATVPCRRMWSDRIKEVELPLFPGYIFAQFAAGDRRSILMAPGTASVVGFGGIPYPAEDSEIEAIRRITESSAATRSCPFLTVGSRVRVGKGPLKGVEGILTKVKNQNCLVVSVTILQRSVAVELDDSIVVPV